MSPSKKKGLERGQQQLDFSAVLTTPPLPDPQVLSVSQLTILLESAFQNDPVLGGKLIVQGELSNVKQSSRGHVYFTLKDGGASINGILWASTAARLNFELEDGIEVYLTGKLEIYKPSGTYSVVGNKIEPVGIGALQLAFQQTKARLEAEGLFLEELKKPIPEFVERIGIVTSGTGAVIHDMLRVIRRKNPLVDVLIAPVKVQGGGACQEIADAIRELNHPSYNLDVIIVARGGGSFEDLYCFSEEPTVRAIFHSQVPIVTGIGHEPDFGLADAAADYSASTPTAAADWAVPDVSVLVNNLQYYAQTLLEEMQDSLLEHEQTLDLYASQLVDMHQYQLDSAATRQEQCRSRFIENARFYFERQGQRVNQWASELDSLSPLKTLSRGYSVVMKDGKGLTSIRELSPGEAFRLRLRDGEADCTVQSVREIQE